MAGVGVQSELDVESSPTVPGSTGMSISTWSWIWFGVALLIIIGFHVRIFGRPLPPAARFP